MVAQADEPRKALIAKLKAAEAEARAEAERLAKMSDDEFDEQAETAQLLDDLKRDRQLVGTVGSAFGAGRQTPRVPIAVARTRRLPRRGHVGGRIRPAARRSSSQPSSRAGPSDESDEPEPGPGSGRAFLASREEIDRWFAERYRLLMELGGWSA